MASKKISELPATTPPLNPAGLVPYTDPDDPTEAATGTTKRTTIQSIADLVVPFDPSDLESAIAGKAPLAHTHDEADITDLDKYTQAEADALLAGKAPLVHTHDDRYYTESEADALLAGKSDTGHGHAGLSTTIASGSLWGGDGTGTPTPVAVGSGLTLAGGALSATSGGGSGVTEREIAALDLGRVLAWDNGTGSGPPGTSPSGHTWTPYVLAGNDLSLSRGTSGFRANANTTNSSRNALILDGITVGGGVQIALTSRRSTFSRASGITLAYEDVNNWLAIDWSSTTLRITRCLAGTTSTLASQTLIGSNASNRSVRLIGNLWVGFGSSDYAVTAYADLAPHLAVSVTASDKAWGGARPGLHFFDGNNLAAAYATGFVLRRMD